MATARQAILTALLERLGTIRVDDGFNSNAGVTVFLGESPLLGEDDPDAAIAVVLRDDVIRWQGKKAFLDLPLEIQAVAKTTLDACWLTIEALLEDIKRAVETVDHTIAETKLERGQTRTLPREPGSTTVGAGVTYVVTYAEGWGTP